MALTGVEYLRTVPVPYLGWPLVPVVAGNKIVTFGSASSFAVLDRPSLTATLYAPGLNQTVCAAVESGGYVYFQPGVTLGYSAPGSTWGPPSGSFWSSGFMRRLDPSTGATIPLSDGVVAPMVAVGADWIVARQRYHIPTNTFSASVTAPNEIVGVNGSRFYSADGTTLHEVSVSANTIIATIALPYAPLPFTVGALIGTVLWWPTAAPGIACVGVDTATNTAVWKAAHTATFLQPPGRNWIASGSFKAASDGYLYRMYDTNTVQIVDPATGEWANETLPTIRAHRDILVIADGQPWIPSDQPR